MAQKAILITTANKSYLVKRFGDESADMLPIGMYLVTDFGVDEHFETLTKENMFKLYRRVIGNKPLENGFIEVAPASNEA